MYKNSMIRVLVMNFRDVKGGERGGAADVRSAMKYGFGRTA